MIDDSKIQRINELARKSKAEGLTETEKKEIEEIFSYYKGRPAAALCPMRR